MERIKTAPINKKQLEIIANAFRRKYHCENNLFLPLMPIIEDLVDKNMLDYEVVSNDDTILPENVVSEYSLKENRIYIKEQTYFEAYQNIGRSRFTLAHELAHYLLFYVESFPVIETSGEVKTYENPEWQANTLAADLLVPSSLTINMEIQDIVKNCGVSEECAIVVHQKRIQDFKKDCKG